MPDNSHAGADQVNEHETDDSHQLEVPQRLSNKYLKYRLWVSFLVNITCWTLSTGFIFGVVLVQTLIKLYFAGYSAAPEIYGQLLFLIIVYVAPMFTCIRLHKWWLKRYFMTYQWDIVGNTLRIQEGVYTRNDVKILLSTIQCINITQGYWERKYGWYRLMIVAAGMVRESKETLPPIAGRIIGCQEPDVIKQLIEKAIFDSQNQI